MGIGWKSLILVICLSAFIFACSVVQYRDRKSYLRDDRKASHPKKVWVSLSVCFGKSERSYGKSHFPYLLATQLAVSLWRNITGHAVIVQVVSAPNTDPSQFDQYVQDLKAAGATGVVKLATNPELGCILHSQLQRAFAHTTNYVDEDDIVAIADVDVFPMDSRLLTEPLSVDGAHYSAWVYQYQRAVSDGGTFAASFIALRAQDWQRLLGDDPAAAKSSLPPSVDRWNTDQALVTRALLSSGTCSLPSGHPQYSALQVPEQPHLDITRDKHCFRGNITDCNRDRRLHHCMFWHFMPYERQRELSAKYSEILHHRAPPSGLVRTAQDVRVELEKILGMRSKR